MRKRLIILLLFALSLGVTSALAVGQDTLHTTFVANSLYQPTHVVTVTAGGGMHALMHKVSDEGKALAGLNKSIGAGGQVQAMYTYFFHKYVGVTGGFGFEVYTGNMNGSFVDSVYHTDKENMPLSRWLYRDFQEFKEREQLYMFTIPVGVTGRINITDPIQIRATVGFGMNAIVASHYRADGNMQATAYYPAYNLHLDADLPQHGLSDYYLHGYQGKIQNTFPVNMFVFGDIGMHYQFTKRWGLYAGIYVSYTCFNAVRQYADAAGNLPELIDYNWKTNQWTYSGIINSKFVEALNPLSVGVKVGFTITYLSPAHCNCEDI